MELRHFGSGDVSPKIKSISSRARADSQFYFPIIDKCKSISKMSINYSQKSVNKNLKRSSTLLMKQGLLEILSDLKASSLKDERVKLAYRALDYMTRESGLLQKELELISCELHSAIYVDKTKVPKEARDWIYEHFDRSACDLDNLLPLALVLDYWKSAHEALANKNEMLQRRFTALNEDLSAREKEIRFLSNELYLSKEINEISTKNTSNEGPKEEDSKEKYEKQIKELHNIIDDLYAQLSFKEDQIKMKEEVIISKEAEIKSLQEGKQKYQQYYRTAKDDASKLREQIDILNSTIITMQLENSPYEKFHAYTTPDTPKATDNFNLTPRPDFRGMKKVLAEHNVSCSTADRVRFLIEMIKSMKRKKEKKLTITKKKGTSSESPTKKNN
jgi:hypothetical protein